MQILCPWCGERPDFEFRSAGEALERPACPDDLDDLAWADYLYARDNRPGLVRELWWHWAGCRQWLRVDRDTVTHEILRVKEGSD
jgi:heterotetrameric sarcosine oxidase delta subunit